MIPYCPGAPWVVSPPLPSAPGMDIQRAVSLLSSVQSPISV
ncbi:unnamed protein product, partial [Staurois parvus]